MVPQTNPNPNPYLIPCNNYMNNEKLADVTLEFDINSFQKSSHWDRMKRGISCQDNILKLAKS